MKMKKVVFLFLLATQIVTLGYGNNRAYYENILNSTPKEINSQNYAEVMKDLMEVKIYAKEHQLHHMQGRSLIKMGAISANMHNYEKAMECYLEAYQLLPEKLDNRALRLINNIGHLYYLNNDMDKAAEYIDSAYKMALVIKDNYTMIWTLNNLAGISNKKGNLEQTEKYLQAVMEIKNNNPQDTTETAAIEFLKAEYLYLKKEYDSAEQLVQGILNLYIGGYSNLEVECLFLLSKIYYPMGNYSQAIAYAKEALQHNVDQQTMIEIYKHLSNIYCATNSYLLAFQYQDSAMMVKDSLLKLNGTNQILRGQIQFDLNNLEQKMVENKAKQKQERMIFMLIIAFAIALLLLFLYIRSTKNKITKLNFEKKENEKLLLEQQLKARDTLALLEQNTYKNEIELKNKQLVSQMLFQSSKNELMEEFIQALSHIPNQSEISELQSIIKRMQIQMKESTGDDWGSFLTYFEQTNPAFLTSLKATHPDLTASDIRLASYIYLSLDTKEIAKLLHITPEHCKKKKQRLAKKLGLSAYQIYSYLTGIG